MTIRDSVRFIVLLIVFSIVDAVWHAFTDRPLDDGDRLSTLVLAATMTVVAAVREQGR